MADFTPIPPNLTQSYPAGYNPSGFTWPSTTSNASVGGTVAGSASTSLRDQHQAATQAPTLVFPSDLKGNSNYPTMTIMIYDYPVNNQTILNDIIGQSSAVTTNPAASTVKNQNNTNPALVPKGGTSPASKGTLKATIVLPITNNITNALQIDWQMEDFAAGQAAIQGAEAVYNDLKKSMTSGASLASALGTAYGSAANTASQLIAPILSSTLQKTVNVIANPKKQAFFYGVQPRGFQFDWAMTPQSSDESKTIANIIQTITKYSLPLTTSGFGSANALWQFPHEFVITFSGVNGFPILSPMVCTGIHTNYTPNSLQIFNSQYPIQVLFSITMLETNLCTQDNPGI